MLVLSTMLAAACAGTLDPLPKPSPGYGQRAEDSTDPSSSYSCGDTVMSDQLTSGGQRVVQATPCWDTGEERSAHDEYVAKLAAEHTEAADRRVDNQRVADEQTACAGLSQRELEHTPFSHRREIAEVIPHREAGNPRGVRIIWKPVPGLTADWMRQAISCHRARFERMGEPPIYHPHDPTLVAHATVRVEDHGGHLEVIIETPDDANGQLVIDRAQSLVHPGVKAAAR